MQAYQLGYRVTTAGAPLNAGKAYFYLTGTTTLANVFEDDALTTPLSNPVVADSAGFFPELVYLDPTKEYRVVIKTSADVTIAKYSADPINTIEGSSGVNTADIVDEAVTAAKLGPTAIEDKLGFTPQAAFAGLTSAAINALLNRVGIVEPYIGTTAPGGALICNGGTIGSASSGGTSRANADTATLFALIWALNATDYPITTSAGAGSTRGANAAADFAANKRLPLPDLRGEFVRGWDNSRGVDTSRVLGSAQTDEFEQHSHNILVFSNSFGGTRALSGLNTAGTTLATETAGTASETRPRNVALNYIIRY
jgi:hypothetical protein